MGGQKVKISELIEVLGKLKDAHGDVEIVCVNNDGPGYVWEDAILTEEYIEFTRKRVGYPFPHLFIGHSR